MEEEVNINSLPENLAKSRSFIVFAGTGAVAGTGVADSWKLLLEALATEAGVDISRRSKSEYPNVAQEIYEKLGKETYDNVIREQLRPTEVEFSSQGIEIIQTTNWIVTTNFDDVMEKTFAKVAELKGNSVNLRTDSLPDLPVEGGFDGERLVYLHGSAHTNYVLLRKEQYEQYYPSVSKSRGPTCLEEYLKFVYTRYPIVFIGFSFFDRFVRECFTNIYKSLEWQDKDAEGRFGYEKVVPKIPQHYALIRKLREGEYKKKENYLADCELYKRIEPEVGAAKIKFVWYDNNIEWTHCLKNVRDMRKVIRVESVSAEAIL